MRFKRLDVLRRYAGKRVKHQIKLTDQMPFNVHYQCIPPYMFDNVKAHLQEILDIGAIQKLHSPWATTVVLGPEKG